MGYTMADLCDGISIHAPHEGERHAVAKSVWHGFNFNPRSPRGGATDKMHTFELIEIFQSTLPTRGSDLLHHPALSLFRYFNPRSPRGGATALSFLNLPICQFQSTLPTRGSDDALFQGELIHRYFNPRSPRGGATATAMSSVGIEAISIHAPHEGERLC